MSDTSTIEDSERKVKLEEYYFQRKLLFGCTVGLFFGLFLWIIAVSTNRWFIVSGRDGIYVESHRRYFRSSHTGIWRVCRYALIPKAASPYVVRNFTSFSVLADNLQNTKDSIVKENFFKDLQKNDLPDLSSITEIDNEFKKHLFAEWFDKEQKDFKALKEKFKQFQKVEKSSSFVILDQSKRNEIMNAVGSLTVEFQFDKKENLTVVIPERLHNALFDGWEKNGVLILKVLNHFAKSLEIEPNVYVGGVRFLLRPPKPPKNFKKAANGFTYNDWKKCTYYNLFADDEAIAADPSIDEDMLDYTRTAATFSVITIFVMTMGFVFTIYTFLNPRYMFKRLAGGVHFISGISSATVCRLLHRSVQHAQEYLAFAFPPGSDYTVGYGFYFGCVVAAINFIACIMFFWYSRKRKGDKAATEELGMADEAINIGR